MIKLQHKLYKYAIMSSQIEERLYTAIAAYLTTVKYLSRLVSFNILHNTNTAEPIHS